MICPHIDTFVICPHVDASVKCPHIDPSVICPHVDASVICQHVDASVVCTHIDAHVHENVVWCITKLQPSLYVKTISYLKSIHLKFICDRWSPRRKINFKAIYIIIISSQTDINLTKTDEFSTR